MKRSLAFSGALPGRLHRHGVLPAVQGPEPDGHGPAQVHLLHRRARHIFGRHGPDPKPAGRASGEAVTLGFNRLRVGSCVWTIDF